MLSSRARACKLCGALHRLFGDHCQRCSDLMTKPLGSGRVFLRDIRRSYVYAIGVDGDPSSAVKFGFTKILSERLRSIQTGSPVKLIILASDFGAKAQEKAIHSLLARDRLHGEWFRRSTKAAELIDAMGKGQLSGFLGVNAGKSKAELPIVVVGDGRLGV